jgi:hypothetical protein
MSQSLSSVPNDQFEQELGADRERELSYYAENPSAPMPVVFSIRKVGASIAWPKRL